MKTPHRHAHRLIWVVLAFALPAMLFAALMMQRIQVENRTPERIEPPSAETNS